MSKFWIPMIAGFFATLVLAQPPMAKMTTVEPADARAGVTVTVTGENLGKASVKKLYLTDGKKDTEVEITEQSDTSLKFKVPAMKGGRFALLVLTGGDPPRLVEEPVRVNVIE